MLTLELTSNSMLSSLPAAAATAVAQRSQGGKQAKRIPLVNCTQMKRPSRNACAAVQNSTSVHSVRTAVELKTTRSNAQEPVNMWPVCYNYLRPVSQIRINGLRKKCSDSASEPYTINSTNLVSGYRYVPAMAWIFLST